MGYGIRLPCTKYLPMPLVLCEITFQLSISTSTCPFPIVWQFFASQHPPSLGQPILQQSQGKPTTTSFSDALLPSHAGARVVFAGQMGLNPSFPVCSPANAVSDYYSIRDIPFRAALPQHSCIISAPLGTNPSAEVYSPPSWLRLTATRQEVCR